MDTREGYTGRTIWITDLVERMGDLLPVPTAVAGLFTVGLLPYALTAAFVLTVPRAQTVPFVVIQTLAATVAVAGPVFIWHYDEHVFPTFVSEVDDVVVDDRALITTVERYEQFFCDRYWLIAAPWTALILAALIANVEYFVTLGVVGTADPAFLTYLVFALWWSVITGIGLHGALTTVLCVRAVGDLELTIDPLHHDGLGGLSTIGYFSIRATLMNSIGSFTLPLAFSIAAGGAFQSLVYVAVAGYIGFILVSFVYPTIYVNRRAQEVRERILKEKRERIRGLQARAAAGDTDGELDRLETQLKIRTLRDDFHEYENVNLYPLSVSILVRLGSSVLLPILFTVIDTYVFTN